MFGKKQEKFQNILKINEYSMYIKVVCAIKCFPIRVIDLIFTLKYVIMQFYQLG